MLHSGMLRPYPQTLDKPGKAFLRRTVYFLVTLINCGNEKFYDVGPWTEFYKILTLQK